jgi:large subunit ribosomal protein L4
MDLAVNNSQGDTVDTIQVEDAVFAVPVNNTVLHQAIVGYQLNRRQGTHDTKTRAQVSGGGRKPWIQKHTGRARQGSIRSPQWRHGGVVFGPHPRDYRRVLPRRLRHHALRCALSEKARRGNIICVDNLDSLTGKTKSMVEMLDNLSIDRSLLVVTLGSQPDVIRAGHNVKKVWTLPVDLLNAHELLRRETLLITVDAVRRAEELWGSMSRKTNRGGPRVSAAAEAPAAANPEAGE